MKYGQIPPAFPHAAWDGITMRDWFATHAPMPTEEQIKRQMEYDRVRNPHNEHRKPPLRERTEIIADLAYEYADAMMKAREKSAK